MKKIITFAIVFFFIHTLNAKNLTQEEVLEDYQILKNVLIEGHPSLYAYTTEEQWNVLFQSFEEKEIPKIKNTTDLFKSLSALTSHVKDGHINVLHPKMDAVPAMFPILVKIIDNKLYADTYGHGVPTGSEIISINGNSSSNILQDLLKYTTSDGNNITKKHRKIEFEFGILYFYEYGQTDTFSVVYSTPEKETKTVFIKSQPFGSIGEQHPLRNSHFAQYHNNANKMDHFKNRIIEKWPYVYFPQSKTAVLTVNSFALDPKEFKSRLIKLFKDIRRKRTKNLIIDVRQNIGGYRANAISLYSFITDQPFQQRVSESTLITALPQENHVIHASDYPEFFSKYFDSPTQVDDRWVLNKDHAQNEMQPYKKTFKGKVVVLIDGNTFSAGSAFALNAKNDADIVLVGQETGGGYYFHTGQFPAVYELPNSKVLLRLSFVRINKYVADNTVAKGSGVLPDHEVPLTVKDLIEGKDTQLDFAIKHFNQMK